MYKVKIQEGEKNEGKNAPVYHPYDATSRSRELPSALLRSFSLEPSATEGEAKEEEKKRREDLRVPNSRAFSVKEFLSSEECEFLIQNTERMGYGEHSDVSAEYPPEYRNNERLIVMSQDLADALWCRLLRSLTADDVRDVAPLGWATEGTWLPVALNECFLFSRYRAGAFFRPHFDGMYKNEYGECSVFTVTVYLNQDFKGGRLLFRSETSSQDAEGTESRAKIAEELADRIKHRLEFDEEEMEKKHPVVATFTPLTGSALVFNHDTFHEGEPVTEGTKYILRTSVMFRRVDDLTPASRPFEADPLWQKSKAIFQSFDKLMAAKDPGTFTSKFLEAQTLQLMHGRCLRKGPDANPLLELPPEMLLLIFTYFDIPKDYLRLMSVCKALRAFVMRGRIWRGLYTNRWGSENLPLLNSIFQRKRPGAQADDAVDPDLMDWLGLFRSRYLMEEQFASIVVYTAEKTWTSLPPGLRNKAGKPLPNPREFTSAVYEEGDPWDNSFSTLSVGSWGDLYFSHDLFGRSSIDNANLSTIWKHADSQGRRLLEAADGPVGKRPPLLIFVILPLLFSNVRLADAWDAETGVWVGKKPVRKDDKKLRSALSSFSRGCHKVPAVTIVDVEMCALYACNTDTGIVAYEYHMAAINQRRTIWRVLLFEGGASSKKLTVWMRVEEHAILGDSILKLAQKRSNTSEAPLVIIARDSSTDPFKKKSREDQLDRDNRREAGIQLRKMLEAAGCTVRDVLPMDITRGARTIFDLPGGDKRIKGTAMLQLTQSKTKRT